MKTLTANQNEDGTYHIVITNMYDKDHDVGKGKVVDHIESTIEIGRGIIEITPLKPGHDANHADRLLI